MAADPHASVLGDAGLLRLDAAVAAAEDRADRAFFEALLHPRFTMRRPGGRVDGREELLAGLATGAHREAHHQQVLYCSQHRAVLSCLVTKTDPGEPVGSAGHTFHNLRTYLRDEDGAWRLLAWLNEPA